MLSPKLVRLESAWSMKPQPARRPRALPPGRAAVAATAPTDSPPVVPWPSPYVSGQGAAVSFERPGAGTGTDDLVVDHLGDGGHRRCLFCLIRSACAPHARRR